MMSPCRDEPGRRQSVGDVQGAVVSDTIKRVVSWPEKPRGYLCRLTALEYLKTRSAGRGRQARNCLEAEVASNPDNARASALLAAFLTRAWLDAVPGSLGKDDLRRARELARRAHDEDPRNVRTNYMMFLTRFYSGDFDEAFDDGRLAIKADPFMAIVAAQIGAAYVSRGAYDQGSALLAPLEKQDSPVPIPVRLVLARRLHEGGGREFHRRGGKVEHQSWFDQPGHANRRLRPEEGR